MRKEVLFKIAKARLVVSRIFGTLIILLLLFTSHSFQNGGVLDILLKITGLILLSICSFGRLWSLIYINGYKSNTLITEGPYSMVRNPLYFFSSIGAIGAGVATGNILVLALIILFFIVYYPFTILYEETNLAGKFGDAYAEYKRRVPLFIPKLSLYKEPEVYSITVNKLVRNFAESMLLLWIFILIQIIAMLQDKGILRVFLKVP